MALPLIDFRGKVTPETDAVLDLLPPRTQAAILAQSSAFGQSPVDVICAVMSEWAESRIQWSDAIAEILSRQKTAAAQRSQPLKKEKAVEDAICKALQAHGIAYQRQVKTESGIADIVLEQAVIEVKRSIKTPATLAQAHGQASMYARALGLKLPIVFAPDIGDSIADPLIVCAKTEHELIRILGGMNA